MAKYKLTKTIIGRNKKHEVVTPHAKRFSLSEAQEWLDQRKKKLGAGNFKSYTIKGSDSLSLSANPPSLVAWEFQEIKSKETAPVRKKHSVKKSALKNTASARRKKEERKDLSKFIVGQKYYYTWYDDVYDHDVIVTVVKRTSKTVTIDGYEYGKRNIKLGDGSEYFKGKLGTFSSKRIWKKK